MSIQDLNVATVNALELVPLESVDVLLPARLWSSEAFVLELIQECLQRPGTVVWRVLMGRANRVPDGLREVEAQVGEMVQRRFTAAGAVARFADEVTASLPFSEQYVAIADAHLPQAYMTLESGGIVSDLDAIRQVSKSWRTMWRTSGAGTRPDPDVSSLLSAFIDAERQVTSRIIEQSELGSTPMVGPGDSMSQVHGATPARSDRPIPPPPSMPPPLEGTGFSAHVSGVRAGEERSGAGQRDATRAAGMGSESGGEAQEQRVLEMVRKMVQQELGTGEGAAAGVLDVSPLVPEARSASLKWEPPEEIPGFGARERVPSVLMADGETADTKAQPPTEFQHGWRKAELEAKLAAPSMSPLDGLRVVADFIEVAVANAARATSPRLHQEYMLALRALVTDLYQFCIKVHADQRGTMDIVTAEVRWPAGLKEIEAHMVRLLQAVQTWEIPGITPEGLGGTSLAVGDSVRILGALHFACFANTEQEIRQVAEGFLSMSIEVTPKKETQARLLRIGQHLKLAQGFEILASAGEPALIAESAVSAVTSKAANDQKGEFSDALKEYKRRMQRAHLSEGGLRWDSHADFIIQNIGNLKVEAGKLPAQVKMPELQKTLAEAAKAKTPAEKPSKRPRAKWAERQEMRKAEEKEKEKETEKLACPYFLKKLGCIKGRDCPHEHDAEQKKAAMPSGAKLVCGCGCLDTCKWPCQHVAQSSALPVQAALREQAAAGVRVEKSGKGRKGQGKGEGGKGAGGKGAEGKSEEKRDQPSKAQQKAQKAEMKELRAAVESMKAELSSQKGQQESGTQDVLSQVRSAVRDGMTEWEQNPPDAQKPKKTGKPAVVVKRAQGRREVMALSDSGCTWSVEPSAEAPQVGLSRVEVEGFDGTTEAAADEKRGRLYHGDAWLCSDGQAVEEAGFTKICMPGETWVLAKLRHEDAKKLREFLRQLPKNRDRVPLSIENGVPEMRLSDYKHIRQGFKGGSARAAVAKADHYRPDEETAPTVEEQAAARKEARRQESGGEYEATLNHQARVARERAEQAKEKAESTRKRVEAMRGAPNVPSGHTSDEEMPQQAASEADESSGSDPETADEAEVARVRRKIHARAEAAREQQHADERESGRDKQRSADQSKPRTAGQSTGPRPVGVAERLGGVRESRAKQGGEAERGRTERREPRPEKARESGRSEPAPRESKKREEDPRKRKEDKPPRQVVLVHEDGAHEARSRSRDREKHRRKNQKAELQEFDTKETKAHKRWAWLALLTLARAILLPEVDCSGTESKLQVRPVRGPRRDPAELYPEEIHARFLNESSPRVTGSLWEHILGGHRHFRADCFGCLWQRATQGRHGSGLDHSDGMENWESGNLVVGDLQGPFDRMFSGSRYLLGLLHLGSGIGWVEGLRGRESASLVVGLGRCIGALRLDRPDVQWVLVFDRETAIHRDPECEALVLQHGGRLKLGIPNRPGAHGEQWMRTVKELGRAELRQSGLNDGHADRVAMRVVALRNSGVDEQWRPRTNEVQARYPQMFAGEFGTVVLPRSKLDELGVSKTHRALPMCFVAEDFQTRLGVHAEVLQPRSKRLQLLTVDASSIRPSGEYTYGWTRTGLQLERRPRRIVSALPDDDEDGGGFARCSACGRLRRLAAEDFAVWGGSGSFECREVERVCGEVLPDDGATDEEAEASEAYLSFEEEPEPGEEADGEESASERDESVDGESGFPSDVLPARVVARVRVKAARRRAPVRIPVNVFMLRVLAGEGANESDLKSAEEPDLKGAEESDLKCAKEPDLKCVSQPDLKCASESDLEDARRDAAEVAESGGLSESEVEARPPREYARMGPEEFNGLSRREKRAMMRAARKAVSRVRAGVTVKVTPKNASDWAHLDWKSANEAEVEKVFKRYGLLEAPMREGVAKARHRTATFGRVITIRNVRAVEEEAEPRVRVCYDGRDGEQVYGSGEKVQREVEFAELLRERKIPASLAQSKLVHCVGVGRGWVVALFDIEGAYLNTKFGPDEVHYVHLSKELEEAVLKVMGWSRPPGEGRIVFRLLGGLYGLVVGGDMWVREVSEYLAKEGWVVLSEDEAETLFAKRTADGELAGLLSLYVDDGTLAGPLDVIEELRSFLEAKYTLKFWKVLGSEPQKVLGCELSTIECGGEQWLLVQSMSGYWSHCVEKAEAAAEQVGLKVSERAVDTPAVDEPPSLETEKAGRLEKPAAQIGSAAYAAYGNDLDIAAAVVMRARYASRWRSWDDKAFLRIVAFLRQFKVEVPSRCERPFVPVQRVCTRDFEESGALQLHVQLDADHGGDLASRKSTTGYLLVLVGVHGTRVVLEGKSKLQDSVAVSTAEAEVNAIMLAAKRVLSVLPRYEAVFGELPVVMWTDASAALGAVRKGFSKTMAYLKRKSHAISLAWLREQVAEWLRKIGTEVNGSDVLTKPLDPEGHWRHTVISLNQCERPEVGTRRCACEECKNVTGHTSAETVRCLNVLGPEVEGEYCEYCRNGHESAAGCACPCWGFQVTEHSWRPQKEQEARVAQLRRKLHARRRKRKSVKAFGRAFSSDEAGDGPGSKRRALDSAGSGAVELRAGVGAEEGLGHEESEPRATARMLRMVRAGYLRRVVQAWADGALRQRRLREIQECLEQAAAEFPIENAEAVRVALNLLHGRHGDGWKWTTLSQVFEVSAQVLSRFARDEPGAGVRSVNRMIEVLNSSWMERRLEEQALEEGGSGSESESDAGEVHQMSP